MIAMALCLNSCAKDNEMSNKYNKLTKYEESIIIHKGTEAPFSGKYNDFSEKGGYFCKRCGAHLYNSNDKFASSCGWPSFDDEVKGAIRRQPDADGRRIEILCQNCGAHLGHVFKGEHLTEKNIRHCVNSASLTFIPADELNKTSKAYFAGGCFWGVEYFFEHKKGVVSAVSGYMGGHTDNPTYEDVCRKNTGHLEVVQVTYKPALISFEDLTRFFFEIHDPTQDNGQGPDIGKQYQSAVFFNNNEEKETIEKSIKILKAKKYKIATKVIPVTTFWKAEEYHQDYYDKHHKKPYCHRYTKRF